ncbi:MAG: TolC family protein [Kofleriaceae bacterium]|jgi:outer membrane protein|nr:TolC family protein [Kofleriaceae bacterium]MBP9167183.1 TolC family protein [Kofleriaceae bacterium]MBP9862778.1 TolC family protein [Kofleriaceae bacterium]
MSRLVVALGAACAVASPASAGPLGAALVAADGGGETPSLVGVLTGPAEPIALSELLDRALRADPTLARIKVDAAIADAAIARARTWDAWGVGADLDASTRSGGGFVNRSRAVTLSGDLSRRLPTGGTAGLHVEAGWQDSRTSLGSEAAYTEAITANLTQPLLRGRGDADVKAAIRAAQLERDATAVATDAAAQTLVRDVVLAYFDLVAAERELAIRKDSLALARERLRVTDAGIAAGGVAPAERISIEQAIATRDEEILNGELQVVERAVALRATANLPIGPGELLLATNVDALDLPARTWDAGALFAAAERSSPELARLRVLEAGATIDVEVSERGVLPSLDLSVALGPSGTADDPGEAAVNLVTFEDFTAAVALSYRTTWGEVAAKTVARTARARREQVKIDADGVRRQLRAALGRALIAVTAAERRHALALRTVALADKALAAEQARLTSGRSRNVDVLARQDELRAAQLRVVRAQIEWHRAATTIAALTGDLLPELGVQVARP